MGGCSALAFPRRSRFQQGGESVPVARKIIKYGVADELRAVGIAQGIYPHVEFIQKFLANPYSKHDLAVRAHNAIDSTHPEK